MAELDDCRRHGAQHCRKRWSRHIGIVRFESPPGILAIHCGSQREGLEFRSLLDHFAIAPRECRGRRFAADGLSQLRRSDHQRRSHLRRLCCQAAAAAGVVVVSSAGVCQAAAFDDSPQFGADVGGRNGGVSAAVSHDAAVEQRVRSAVRGQTGARAIGVLLPGRTVGRHHWRRVCWVGPGCTSARESANKSPATCDCARILIYSNCRWNFLAASAPAI